MSVGVQKVLIVVTHATLVFKDDLLKIRAAILDLEQLVDLLLILADSETHLGVIDHELQLLGDPVLVHGYRHPAERLGGAHGGVKTRTVVTDDGYLVAALKSELGEPAGEILNAFGELVPGP